jgi:molybdopterin synthase catalytic subunit
MRVHVTDAAFSPETELAGFGHRDAGAMASFVGYCRPLSNGVRVESLQLEHYPGFTESEIARLANEVNARHDLIDLLVVHRVGAITPGEPIVLVAALSLHRAAAFVAVSELMDYLKTDAPIWKKEIGPDGARWIEPTPDDRVRRAAHARKP